MAYLPKSQALKEKAVTQTRGKFYFIFISLLFGSFHTLYWTYIN